MAIRAVKKVQDRVRVENAFISVWDKTGIEQLVEGLFRRCPSLTIYSSGGTYAHLQKNLNADQSKRVIDVSEYTGLPETDGGLVKTLHHKLFLGYLTETFSEKHQADLKREKAVPIDLVIVDLYPFEVVTSIPDSTPEDARGNIDVGGPSALRAAAKNFLRVMTVADCDAQAYENLLAQLEVTNGYTSLGMRFKACQNTFQTLANYDTKIAVYLATMKYDKIKKLYQIF